MEKKTILCPKCKKPLVNAHGKYSDYCIINNEPEPRCLIELNDLIKIKP